MPLHSSLGNSVGFYIKKKKKSPLSILPSSVPKCRKTVMFLMKKVQVLGKFFTGKSYIAVGYEFNANESTIHIKAALASWLGMVAHVCNPSTLEAKVGGSPEVRSSRPV